VVIFDKMKPRFLFPLVLFYFTSCLAQEKPIRYVALGDSYTIGTGAKEEEAWPVLLTKHLNDKQIHVQLIANPARNGYSTQNLIEEELPVLDTCQADLVTVLIGVNDWVRGVDKETFQKNLRFILDHIQKDKAIKIILVTIPDFGLTPQGALYSKGRDISKGISEFNTIIKAEAKKRGLPCVDIFPLSKKMKNDASLVADDGLHPSAKEYAEWEKLIFLTAHKLFSVE